MVVVKHLMKNNLQLANMIGLQRIRLSGSWLHFSSRVQLFCLSLQQLFLEGVTMEICQI